MHMYMIHFLTCLLFGLHSFGLPSTALVDYHLERGGMLLHDMVGVVM